MKSLLVKDTCQFLYTTSIHIFSSSNLRKKSDMMASRIFLKQISASLRSPIASSLTGNLCQRSVTGFGFNPLFKPSHFFTKTKSKIVPLRQTFPDEFIRFYAAPADWSGHPGHESMVLLTDKNIDSYVRSSPSLLIMFYAPWCYHCKSSKPEFAKAAGLLASKLPSATLAAIDCMMYPDVYQKYKVEGYPTILYFNRGSKVGEYSLSRRAADFVNFMLREPKSKNDMLM